jgi:ABC-type lipoprotein export system ATPase subunit
MIIVEHISKTFHSGRGAVPALSDVSFYAKAGVATAIIGKSGSGKTTLLNCIGGLIRPDEGSVTCFGTEMHKLSNKGVSLFQRRNVGFMFQFGNLLSYYSVFDNIAFPLVLNGIARREREKRVAYLLERIGMTGAERALPNELSGGEAQRVAAARAVAHSPRVLLADEPTASLDSETGKKLVMLLLEIIKEQKCSLVLSTHDPELINLCDRSIQMRDGRLLEERT